MAVRLKQCDALIFNICLTVAHICTVLQMLIDCELKYDLQSARYKSRHLYGYECDSSVM